MTSQELRFPSGIKESQIIALCLAEGLPKPNTIKPLRITPEHNCVHLLTFSGSSGNDLLTQVYPRLNGSGDVSLVLHICCQRFEHVRVPNEVAVHRWVRNTTTIPIPQIAAYGLNAENALGFEFILYEYINGVSADKIYPELDDAAKRIFIDQISDYIIQLNNKSWSHIGSLAMDEAGEIQPAPIIEYRSWHCEDVIRYWAGTNETVDTLNANGPFSCYSEFVIANMEKSKYVMSRHPSLLALHDRYAIRIDGMIEKVEMNKALVNQTRYIMSHKDLHFGNILVSPEEHTKVVAVIDWELTQIVPVQLWDPGNFLWSGATNPGYRKEQQHMVKMFEDACRSKGAAWVLDDACFANDFQKHVQEALTHLRRLIMSFRWFSSPVELQETKEGFEETLRKLGS